MSASHLTTDMKKTTQKKLGTYLVPNLHYININTSYVDENRKCSSCTNQYNQKIRIKKNHRIVRIDYD